MALGFESGMGAIASLFDNPKTNRMLYSDRVEDEIVNQLSTLKADTAANRATLGNYENAIAQMRPLLRRTSEADIGLLGDLSQREFGYDPVRAYERIRSGNLAAFDDQAGKIANRGSVADKLALAARGYGGRGAGAYEQILRNSRISGNLAPVLNTIFGNLGSDTNATDVARNRSIQNILAAIQGRGAIPQNVVNFEGTPIALRNAASQAGIAGVGALGDASRNNTAGFETKGNKWASFLRGMGRSADEAGGTAMNLAAMYFGGGMGGAGGMLGGLMGGGGGGGGAAPQAPISSYQFNPLPPAPNYPTTVGWGAPSTPAYSPAPWMYQPPTYASGVGW